MLEVTKRDVDTFLAGLQASNRSISNGSDDEFRGRCALLDRRIDGFKERLGVPN